MREDEMILQPEWYLRFLDGSEAQITGDLELDTEGGVALFGDESGSVRGFVNLGAVIYGERVDEEEDE